MNLNLRPRDTALINFRRDLPDFLSDGAPCFIEIDARPGGAVNPVYMAGMDNLRLKQQIIDRQYAARQDEKDADEIARIEQRHEAGIRAFLRDRAALLYDACVIEWRSNILDGKAPIVCDRERFLGLFEARVPEIATALVEFEVECLEAGRIVAQRDEDLEKN